MKRTLELCPIGLEKFEKIFLVCHVGPDGDALGSLLGLCLILENMGKKVYPIVPDEVPENLRFIPGFDKILNAETDIQQVEIAALSSDLWICLDHGQPFRTGEAIEKLFQQSNSPKWCIDHHPDPWEGYSAYLHDQEAGSTCELITLHCENNWMNKDAATALMCGILTDTGGLHHAVRQLTFDACSKLLALKVDFSQLNKDIFDRNSETKLRVTGYVLSKKMKVFPEFKLVLASINSIELAKLNSVKGDTEGLVNQLLSIECAEVAVLITERIPGNVRISFRSKGLIPVNTFVSNNFRGGGHRNAAGGSYMGKVSDVIKIIMQSYPEYVSDYL